MGNSSSSSAWDLASNGTLGPYYMNHSVPRSDRLLYMRNMFSRSSSNRRPRNSRARNRHSTEEPKLIPTQFYLDESTFLNLIKNRIVAPRYKGSEVKTDEYRLECPICFCYYPALNYTVCCKQVRICSHLQWPFQRCGHSVYAAAASFVFRERELKNRHRARFVKLLYLKLYTTLMHKKILK
jgi:hypothetical protein